MKNKHILLMGLMIGLLNLILTTSSFGQQQPHIRVLPHTNYDAEEDHLGGAACVQMALNACANSAESQFHSQTDIYSFIMMYNSSVTEWFCNPDGVKGILMESSFSPCGNWVDFSHTDKYIVLGKMLYYIEFNRYLTPVSIGGTEHWVSVYGYQSDIAPTSTTLTVDLEEIYFYDPNPGDSQGPWVKTGSVWLNDPVDYWGVPYGVPGTTWKNKYIAVIEPPAIDLTVRVPEWILQGAIIPVLEIERNCYRWLEDVRKREPGKRPIDILDQPLKIGKPILIDTDKYQYYLIPFKNRRLAAIFNAYTGKFEELHYFTQAQTYILDSEVINKRIKDTLREYKVKGIRISGSKFKYRPKIAGAGRLSPTWEAATSVTDFYGKKHDLTVSLNSAGQVIKGLEALPIPTPPSPWEPHEKKRPLFSIHTGTAIPMGDFADFYKAGFNILVDFEYPLKNRYSLRALLGYNQFRSKSVLLDDTSIVNINLNLKYSTPGKPLAFFAEAGPGYYIIKDVDNKMGVNVGCGFHYRLSQRIRLEFAAHYNTIFTNEKNTYFLHLASGLIIHLR